MGKQVIVGIDVGSQSAKVVFYDLQGNIVCEGRHSLSSMHLAEPNVVEHPGDDLWDALKAASQKAMAAYMGDHEDIIGIGVGSIRCCRVLIKANGDLAAPAISWMDDRVSRPYEHTNPDVAYVTSTSGYLSHRLTGEKRDCAGNYYGQFPLDYSTWQWSEDPAVIKKFNIPREMLFDLQVPGTVLGTVTKEAAAATGLPQGVPVACVSGDKPVEALGAGLLDDSSAMISLGTYIALLVTGEKIPTDPQAFWAVMSSVPHRFLYEGFGIRRGMWTISWFRDLLGGSLDDKAQELGMTSEEFLSREAEKVPVGSDGLMTVLDWLANPWEPFKRGVMIGFDAHMDYAYMYRSILEGIAYTMKNNCDAVCREQDKKLEAIIISGGGSNSDLFMQIFADVFNLPAKRNVVNGSASIGAAINTAVAIGVYRDYEEAVGAMVRVKNVFNPIAENVALYEKLNAGVYRDITQYTDAVLQKTYDVLKPEQGGTHAITGWNQNA